MQKESLSWFFYNSCSEKVLKQFLRELIFSKVQAGCLKTELGFFYLVLTGFWIKISQKSSYFSENISFLSKYLLLCFPRLKTSRNWTAML